jgi:hypothetical protein
MNAQVRENAPDPITELRQYVGSAYKAITSMEQRLTRLEHETIQHGQKITDLPRYLSKPAEPVRTGIPAGYEVNENPSDGLFYWRKMTVPIAKAHFGEDSFDLARLMATYHYLRAKHEARERETEMDRNRT